RRRRHPPPLPGAGQAARARPRPGALRRHPPGLREPARPGHAAATPPVRGGPPGEYRRHPQGGRMSEPPPPPEPAGPPVGPAENVNGDAIDRLLADFRAWLTEHPAPPAAEPAPAFDLSTLVEQFVALRHEVNLQTRASRAQLEHNAQALEQLARGLDLA